GVDGTFSVWRHARCRNGFRSQNIALCTMVHGFDIPLEEATAYSTAFARARYTLQSLPLPLLPLKTNARQVINVNWEHVVAASLVAALQNFKGMAGTCLVGSSEPYHSLILPWGSNPITDTLLSSGSFAVLHDGASHSRTRKVAEISDWKEGCANLRVCWQGDL